MAEPGARSLTRLESASTRAWSMALQNLALPLTLVGIGALNLVSLMRYPRPFVDEVQLVGRAWSFLQTGHTVSPVEAAAMADQGVSRAPVQLLGAWLQSIPLRVLGLSLLSVRLESLAFGLALLVAVYYIGKRLYGAPAGLISVLLVGLSDAFLISSHLARYDIIIAATGFGAVALTLWDDEVGVPFKSLVAGLMLGLAFEIHGNAALFGPPGVTLLFADEGRRLLRSRRLYGFVAGVCVGLLFYMAIHVLARPETGLSSLSSPLLSEGSIKRPPFTVLDPAAWFESLGETVQMILSFGQVRAVLVPAVLAVLVVSRRPSDRKLLALFCVLFLEFVGIIAYKPFYYEILLSPATDLMTAAALATLFGWLRHSRSLGRWRAVVALDIALAASGAVLLLSVVGTLLPLQRDANADYDVTNARLRAALPPGSVLIGDHTFWFGLTDYRFIEWIQLPFYMRGRPGSTLVDAYRGLGADYLIVGPDLRWNITVSPDERPSWESKQNISKADWDRFITDYGDLVTSVETQTFGDVSVYRIRNR